MSKIFTYIVLILTIFVLSNNKVEAIWNIPAAPVSATGSSSNPCVGIDKIGNAVAVWSEYDGSNSNIKASTLSFCGSWTNPATLSTGKEYYDSMPQVAMDPNGNAVAVWERRVGTRLLVQGAMLPFGETSWTLTNDLSPRGEIGNLPKVAIDSNGNVVAIWQKIDKSGNHIIYGATLECGSDTWKPTSNVSLITQNTHSPHLVLDLSGNAVVVWVDFSKNTVEVATLAFGSNSWSAPQIIFNGSLLGETKAAVDVAGNVIAIWERVDPTNSVIEAATLRFGETVWSSPMTISNVPSPDRSYGPNIVFDHMGNAIAIWSTIRGTDAFIESATLLFESTSWSPISVLTKAGEQSIGPQIVVDSDGNAIAIWSSGVGLNNTIQAATLLFNGTWSGCTNLSEPCQYSGAPTITMNSFGYAVASWINELDNINQVQAITWSP